MKGDRFTYNKRAKYHYNPSTLRFEKIERSWKSIALIGLGFLCGGVALVAVGVLISLYSFDSPKDKFLKNEIAQLELEYDLMYSELDTLSYILEQLQKRDNSIYRVIFEADPVDENFRRAGIGGTERFRRLRNMDNGAIVSRNLGRIEELKRQLVTQSRSYDELVDMIHNKEDLLVHIPAIQPVSNKDLTRIASGFGMRIHPIYKTRKMHEGLDFTAPRGTEIFATGDGVITKAGRSAGYGKMVEIAHGYGYRSRYAHMQNVDCRIGQRVKRGERIGFVGSTGLSTAPHLHYEIIKDGRKIDPINFFFNDLTDEEYATVIELANKANQSFD